MIALQRSAVVYLPLHGGKAPQWLLSRMKSLGRAIVDLLVEEFGSDGLLTRISDPFWFQALACVLAYDWHSSGTTTVLTGVLKSIISPSEHGVLVAGGKGARSKETPVQLAAGIDLVGAPGDIATYQRASRLCAKVDSAGLQDGYHLYHHSFFLAASGRWAVIQQGMNVTAKCARRYHWSSDSLLSFVKDPHAAILSDTAKKVQGVVNLVDSSCEPCQEVILDLLQDGATELAPTLKRIQTYGPAQRTLLDWAGMNGTSNLFSQVSRPNPTLLWMLPRKINWNAISLAAEIRPQQFEDALLIKGLGASTLRGLALVSAMVYGHPPSFRDPVKYSFAFGGKDGVPFPVDRRGMEETTRVIHRAVTQVRLGSNDERRTLRTLAKLTEKWSVAEEPPEQQPGLPRWDPT